MAFPFARPRLRCSWIATSRGHQLIAATMEAIRTAGTGATFVIVGRLDERKQSRKRRRIDRRKRKALKALEKQTF